MADRTRAQGERERLKHAVGRLRATLDAMEIALTLPGPLGHETAQAVVQNSLEIAMFVARHDAFELTEQDAKKEST